MSQLLPFIAAQGKSIPGLVEHLKPTPAVAIKAERAMSVPWGRVQAADDLFPRSFHQATLEGYDLSAAMAKKLLAGLTTLVGIFSPDYAHFRLVSNITSGSFHYPYFSHDYSEGIAHALQNFFRRPALRRSAPVF